MPGSNDYSMDPVLWDSEDITLNSPPSSANLQTQNTGTNWEEVKNKRWNSYLLNLAQTLNKINVKKARKYFDQLWDNEASLREVTDIGDNAKKKLDDLIFNFRDDWSLLKEKVDTPIEETKPSVNFNTVREALLWLTDNGYNTRGVDNMYGANTDIAINTALQDLSLDSNIKNQLKVLLEQYKGKWVPLKKQTIVHNATPTNTLTTSVGLKTINYGLGRIFALDEPPYSSTLKNLPTLINPLLVNTSGVKWGNLLNDIPTITSLLENNSFKIPYSYKTLKVDGKTYLVLSPTSGTESGNIFAFDGNTGKVRRIHERFLFGVHRGSDNTFEENYNWVDPRSLFENTPISLEEIWLSKHPAPEGIGTDFRNWQKAYQLALKNGFKYLQGGKMNQLEILKKAFINYLVQVTGAKTELDLAKLGLDLIKQLYQLFTTGIQDGSIEVSQDGQVNVKGRKAALGAKLSYFNKLQGKCPEGQQLVTFKIGGRMCTACLKGDKIEKKQTTNQQPKRLDPEKTPVLPGGKYPAYWTADDRIKWERKYGLKDEGAAVSPPKKNKLGAALQLLLNKNR